MKILYGSWLQSSNTTYIRKYKIEDEAMEIVIEDGGENLAGYVYTPYINILRGNLDKKCYIVCGSHLQPQYIWVLRCLCGITWAPRYELGALG